jgi:hypothetical protein
MQATAIGSSYSPGKKQKTSASEAHEEALSGFRRVDESDNKAGPSKVCTHIKSIHITDTTRVRQRREKAGKGKGSRKLSRIMNGEVCTQLCFSHKGSK